MPLKVYAPLDRVVNLFGNVGREVFTNATSGSGQFVNSNMVTRVFHYIDFNQVAGLVQ